MITAGDRIGPLFVERRIGAGGMGEVYLARDERLERLVAIKLLPAARSMDPGAHARMLREARSLSVLKHPGIVTIHDIGVHGGSSYIVMEYVEGETFDELIRRRGKLPPEEAVNIIAQVGDAVAAAHAAGVLHRDLKSANLMIERGGGVKVLDFGLAKRTETGSFVRQSLERKSAPGGLRASTDVGSAQTAAAPTTGEVSNEAIMPTTPAPSSDVPSDETQPASSPSGGNSGGNSGGSGGSGTASGDPQTVVGAGMGTPGWAPPELFAGLAADERSDVFSLGCVFYHLVTGKPPFDGASWGSQAELINAGARPPSVTGGVPAAFDRVLASVLDPDPDKRPTDVRALITALRAAVVPPRRHRAINTAIVIGGVAALGVGAIVVARAMSSTKSTTREARKSVSPLPPVQLTTTGGCAYSPTLLDDNTVVFNLTKDGAVDLYRLSLAPGSKPVRLTSDKGWEWRSAAGATPNEAVFMVQAKEVAAIETIDIVTGARRRLVDQSGASVWAGDAYYYAPAAGGGLRRIRNGTDDMFLALPPNRPIDTITASPDGKRLGLMLFDKDRLPEVCSLEIAQPKLACVDVSASSARPAFSAAGDALYYEGLGDPGIMRVPVAGGPAVEVLHGNKSAVGGLAVSPTGRTLVYSACNARTELISVVNQKLAPLVDDDSAAAPIVGPDGVVLFVRGGRPNPALVVRTRDGRLREHYARKGAVLSDVAIASDGDRVAFVVAEGTAPGIYITRLAISSTPNRITEDPKDSRPLFVGDHLLFTRSAADGTPRLMQVALDGSGAESVSTRPRKTVAAGGDRTLLSSPDGQDYYWWDAKTRRETPAPPPPSNNPPLDVAMSPDGRWILYVGGANGQELWRARSDGSSKVERINELPGDRNALEGAIDNDGNALITMYSWDGELWIVPPRDGLIW